jgi:hypothetical protein
MSGTTTSITYGSQFSHQETADGILGYINGGEYTEAQTDALLAAFMDAMCIEVDQRLAAVGATWLPATSEFLIDIDDVDSLPDSDAMADLFDQAWAAVEARFEEIEAAVVAP